MPYLTNYHLGEHCMLTEHRVLTDLYASRLPSSYHSQYPS